MKKGLLIGNGFTSQVIPEYNSAALVHKLKEKLPIECEKIETFFSKFRISKPEKLYWVDYRYFWGEPEDEIEFCSPSAYQEHKNQSLQKHICGVLLTYGFSNEKALCDKYFFEAGLGYEIFHKEIVGIESPLKILDLAKHLNYFPSSWHRTFTKVIMDILYNEGNFHFNNSNGLIDKKRSIKFFSQFSTVFTTNYDLVIDDLIHDKVKHLHGGFCHQSPYERSYRNILSNNYYIVLGADGEEKYRFLSGYRPTSKLNLLENYFTSLATEDFDEFHIFGYSGENDAHINDAILYNDKIRKIIYYCSPDNIHNNDFKFHYASKFVLLPHINEQAFKLESWNNLWNKII